MRFLGWRGLGWSRARGPRRALGVLALLVLSGGGALHAASRASDEPERGPDPRVPFKTADSYAEAVRIWQTPEDVAAWMAASVTYDTARALRLSESREASGERIAIHAPAELFAGKAGVCVDLARFGVETLRRIAPDSEPGYVMIEFDPIQVRGHTLRRHWLASFKREGKLYFFADSKRPGHIAGPYEDTRAFIADYERYRERAIVAFRELPSYEKQRRTRLAR